VLRRATVAVAFRMLRKRPMQAGDLAEAFPITKGSLSHHFNILKNAGLVRCERRGQFQVYSLNASVVEETMSILMELFGTEKRRRR
jgi:DNA-binding transcriptional ArsR family regulator